MEACLIRQGMLEEDMDELFSGFRWETPRVSLETQTRRLRLDQTNTELSVFYRRYVFFFKETTNTC